jgi:hypothetical protein
VGIKVIIVIRQTHHEHKQRSREDQAQKPADHFFLLCAFAALRDATFLESRFDFPLRPGHGGFDVGGSSGFDSVSCADCTVKGKGPGQRKTPNDIVTPVAQLDGSIPAPVLVVGPGVLAEERVEERERPAIAGVLFRP